MDPWIWEALLFLCLTMFNWTRGSLPKCGMSIGAIAPFWSRMSFRGGWRRPRREFTVCGLTVCRMWTVHITTSGTGPGKLMDVVEPALPVEASQLLNPFARVVISALLIYSRNDNGINPVDSTSQLGGAGQLLLQFILPIAHGADPGRGEEILEAMDKLTGSTSPTTPCPLSWIRGWAPCTYHGLSICG